MTENFRNRVTATENEFDTARARAETPGIKYRIHFNNCGASLMPKPVLDAIKSHLDLEARIGGYEAEKERAPFLNDTYRAIADLLHASPEEIAIVENATQAWDMAFYSSPFEPGDQVLTCMAEYASNYIAFLQTKKKKGIEIVVVPDEEYGQIDLEALRRLVSPRTRMIAITHVPTHGGLVNPAKEVGQIAREYGIAFLLDACQSVGQMPVDVQEWGVDFLSGTGRKFLRGPRGVGFLYVKKDWILRLIPPVLDLHSATWIARDQYEIRDDARRFENWESNIAAKIGLGVAVRYALYWGLSPIYKRITFLADYLRQGLSEIPDIKVHDLGRVRCGIVSFTSKKKTPVEIVKELSLHRINVSMVEAKSSLLDMSQRGLPALVRAGLHYFNTADEINEFLTVLRKILYP